uniref:Histidine--tRNA ligase n=1 Tax=candidate division WOR-3 bacterium TaxID=2052148 RepID=A0A7C4XC25_UNCW3
MKYQRPKGTRDIWDLELKRIEAVKQKARAFFGQNGFCEIKTPTFEAIELFTRSIGEHTDIVEKEMYTFEHDKKIYALKPEGTAPVLRAVIENRIKTPARLLYIGQMFRKEKPQKGRYREFLQIGIELLGESEPFFDAEIIDLGNRFLKQIGAKEFSIEINSIGCPKCRMEYKGILTDFLKDKIDNLCPDCQRRFEKNFLRIFDCKNEICEAIYNGAPKITDHLCPECGSHYNKTKEFLKKFDIEYQENKKLVRGLDYYTRTVFEFKLKGLGAQSTVIAGGRYDLLMKELGGDDLPCIGWAMGVERMLLALSEDSLEIKKTDTYFVAVMGEDFFDELVKLRKIITASGKICIVGNPLDSIKNQLKDANHYKADYTIIYGTDEANQGVYTIKDMRSGEQKKIPKDELPKVLTPSPTS